MLFPYIFRLLIWPGIRLTLRLLQCFLKEFYFLHSRYNLLYLSVHRWEFDIIPCSSKLWNNEPLCIPRWRITLDSLYQGGLWQSCPECSFADAHQFADAQLWACGTLLKWDLLQVLPILSNFITSVHNTQLFWRALQMFVELKNITQWKELFEIQAAKHPLIKTHTHTHTDTEKDVHTHIKLYLQCCEKPFPTFQLSSVSACLSHWAASDILNITF